jgi:hypothetical protein
MFDRKIQKNCGSVRVTTCEFVISVSKSIDLCKLKVDPEWGQRNLFSKRLLGSQAYEVFYKNCREIRDDKIAVCEKSAGLRSGNFSDLNTACSKVLVPVKIFQFQDMLNENRFLGTFRGHSKRPNSVRHQRRLLIIKTADASSHSKRSCFRVKTFRNAHYFKPCILNHTFKVQSTRTKQKLRILTIQLL